jgi:peptidoglycan/LPS O-acetylase OafA/YrhL
MSNDARQDRVVWLDGIRGVAILWIFLVHFVERFVRGSYFANPSASWPSLSERFAQLAPLEVPGFGGVFANTLRYVGWLGDQGVQVFVVASGFGLALGALARARDGRAMSAGAFYRRRLFKLLPQWWAVHLAFIATSVMIGVGTSPADWRTLASLLGLRMIPGVMYYFSPAWWYIGALLQLYLVFPILARWLIRTEPRRFLVIVGGGAVILRAVGLLAFSTFAPQYLDWWSRGAVFISRLPEFAFGMAFAAFYADRRAALERWTRSPGAIVGWIGVYVLGNTLSFLLLGMAVAYLLTGAALFVLLYAVTADFRARPGAPLQWCGRNSYPLFLVHHPVIIYLVPSTLSVAATGRIGGLLALTLGATVVVGLALQEVTNRVMRILNACYLRFGSRGFATRLGATAAAGLAVLFGAEGLVRTLAPQEVYGWGERPALRPHDELAYTLKPSSVTRLRWQSYDYLVEANELGFPGPSYPEATAGATLRILVTGDAFSSAEGVDTEDAWPRLLEDELTDSGLPAEVLNLSITGWGPNQYAAAVEQYAPDFEPDMILVSFFVNEFDDIDHDQADFHSSIGFHRPRPDGIRAFLTLRHLSTWTRTVAKGRLRELFGLGEYRTGYFFGNFEYLERENRAFLEEAAPRIEQRLAEIRAVSASVGAELFVLLVPAPAQVADPADLRYYPRGLDIEDTARFDIDQPQRIAMSICRGLDIECVDLRPPLRARASEHPYQPANMHWTERGHEIVADFVRESVVAPRAQARLRGAVPR